jgi:hypothetical protein
MAGPDIKNKTLDELDEYWNQVKQTEKSVGANHIRPSANSSNSDVQEVVL